MITFHPFHLELSLPVAQALLAFTSKDSYRQHLGVGIDGRSVCATDGHTALLLDGATFADGADPSAVHGKVWNRATLDTAIKVARATKQPVTLQYGTCQPLPFPPIRQVLPADGIAGNDCPIGFNPAYVGQLSLVAKACGAEGVRLTALRGALDPIGFRVSGDGLDAHAVIMPMRVA
jgi:hypothetical protein